jgi:multiple sugar transport system ATP-binding protein
MTLADKIVVLSRGRIQQIGDPQSIYALPANEMVASFLGNPPMNIVPAIYKGNNFDISGQLLAIPENIKNALNLHPEQICNLGIRPDHIYIKVDAQGTSRTIPQRSGEYREEEVSDLLVEVEIIESLGRETLISVSLPDSFGFITVQVAGGVGLHPGERLNLQLD